MEKITTPTPKITSSPSPTLSQYKHLLLKQVSIISNGLIRYEGTLASINDKSLTLSNVRFCGTEDRELNNPVPPRSEIFEFILFNQEQIKQIIQTPPYYPQNFPPQMMFNPYYNPQQYMYPPHMWGYSQMHNMWPGGFNAMPPVPNEFGSEQGFNESNYLNNSGFNSEQMLNLTDNTGVHANPFPSTTNTQMNTKNKSTIKEEDFPLLIPPNPVESPKSESEPEKKQNLDKRKSQMTEKIKTQNTDIKKDDKTTPQNNQLNEKKNPNEGRTQERFYEKKEY